VHSFFTWAALHKLEEDIMKETFPCMRGKRSRLLFTCLHEQGIWIFCGAQLSTCIGEGDRDCAGSVSGGAALQAAVSRRWAMVQQCSSGMALL
jgi:hypothetical protein